MNKYNGIDFKFELTEGLKGIVLTLLSMLNSKKFLAAGGSAVAIYQQTGDLRQAAIPVVVYVVAQAGADWGKEAGGAHEIVIEDSIEAGPVDNSGNTRPL